MSLDLAETIEWHHVDHVKQEGAGYEPAVAKTVNIGRLKVSEACGLLLAEACRERRGTLDPEEGYLAILDGRPLLICRDCRAVVRAGSHASE